MIGHLRSSQARGQSHLLTPCFPILPSFLRPVIVLLIAITSASVPATAHAQAPPVADAWHHLAVLQPGTRVHISSDKKGKTCFFASVDDATLVCSRRPASGTHYTFARSEVRTVTLTRYTVSTLAGMGIGAGGRVRHRRCRRSGRVAQNQLLPGLLRPGPRCDHGPRWRDRFYRRRRNRRSLRFSSWPHPLSKARPLKIQRTSRMRRGLQKIRAICPTVACPILRIQFS